MPELSPRDFDRIAKLIDRTVGIQLRADKRATVEGRLRRRVRALGLEGVSAYCQMLFGPGGMERELQSLVDAITTNKTDFFREPDHFTLLRETLVPEMLSRRRGARPTLKLWSAACSTGAEAYSAAMVMADMIERGASFDFEILGTDISAEVVETAALGIYAEDFVGPTPPALRRFLMPAQSERMRGKVRIAPPIRRRVRFRRLNLIDPRYAIDHDFDAAFLRNVLIYFDRATQAAVVRKTLGHLRTGGFLVLSHTETLPGAPPGRQVAPAVFQKEDA